MRTGNPLLGTLANSEDPDEMLHNLAFHVGQHCLLRQNQSSEKKYKMFLEIITYDPSIYIYIMDHLDIIVCSFMENIIGLKRV